MEIEEDEAEEGPAAPVVLVEPGPESESPDLTDSEDEFDPDGEDLAFDEDEELIQTDLAEEDEDEKRRRRREQKRRKAAGGAEGGEGAEGEVRRGRRNRLKGGAQKGLMMLDTEMLSALRMGQKREDGTPTNGLISICS